MNINKITGVNSEGNIIENIKDKKEQKIIDNNIEKTILNEKKIYSKNISQINNNIILDKNLLKEISKLNSEIKKIELEKLEKLKEINELKKEIDEIKNNPEFYFKLKEINQIKNEIIKIETERMEKVVEIKKLIFENKYNVNIEKIIDKWL